MNRQEAYDAGYTDRQIADVCNISISAAKGWRLRRNLSVNKKNIHRLCLTRHFA